MGKCLSCGKQAHLNLGICYQCASFESLIEDKVDLFDKPPQTELNGSESLNILNQVLKAYGLFESDDHVFDRDKIFFLIGVIFAVIVNFVLGLII